MLPLRQGSLKLLLHIVRKRSRFMTKKTLPLAKREAALNEYWKTCARV